MEKNSKKTSDIFVERLLGLFGQLDVEELKKDMDRASKLTEKENTKFIKLFIQKYSKMKLDEKTCKDIHYEIISKLINTREDFSIFMRIYMLTEDKVEAEALRHHYILKAKKLNKAENGDLISETYVKFGISLSCIYDLKSYYDKFIKGIFRYLQLSFKEQYLYGYIKMDYFNPSDFKFYKDNSQSLENSLNKMIFDMKRIIHEHTDEASKKNSTESKLIMDEKRFRILLTGSHLARNEAAKNIYKECQSNDEILLQIKKLIDNTQINENEELYNNLLLFEDNVKNYIIKENQKITKAELEKTIANHKTEEYLNLKKIKEIEEEFQNLKNENKELENNINDLKTTINKHEATIKSQQTIINQHEANIKSQQATTVELKAKIEFMEPIVLSLICRKAINHSIIQILRKHKKELKVVLVNLPNNEIKYDITFIDSVNNVSPKELNDLINKIFLRKDLFNKDSHLVDKALPPFIQDLWDKIKKHLELNPNEIKAFDTIINNEIKSSFVFGGEDMSIKDYLKNVNLSDFGK